MRAFNPNGVSDLQILCTVLETCSRENFGIAPGSTEPQAEAVCALALEKITKIIGQSLEASDHPLVDEVPNLVSIAVRIRDLEHSRTARDLGIELLDLVERASGLSNDQLSSLLAQAEAAMKEAQTNAYLTKIGSGGVAPRGAGPIVTTLSGGA